MDIGRDISGPIYLKVAENFKKQILTGILKPDEKLPSVRELAMTMMVNPNTIQKAYSELEREGYLYVVVGRGNFVSNKVNEIKKGEIKNIKSQLQTLSKKLSSLGVNVKNLDAEINKIGGKV